MPDQELLATEFAAYRDHLRTVAYRMLGSSTDADDAVQEAWVRLSRADASTIDNLGGWLTTVVSEVCLDMLRAREVRIADAIDDPSKEVASADSRHDPERQRELVTAFLAAARQGEFDRLLALLDPEVELVPDAAAERMGTPSGLRGASDVAGVFSGRAQAAQPALVDGLAGLAWATGGTVRVVFTFALDGDRIVRIDTIADPARLAELEVELLEG